MIGIFKKLFGGADEETSQPSNEGAPAAAKKAEKPQKPKASGEADYEGFVSYVVRHLVNNPDAVRLEVAEGNGDSTILIHCEKSDIAKVIGKRGRTISALRLLVGGAASRDGKHIKVDVVD